jgi:hypothetical protein
MPASKPWIERIPEIQETLKHFEPKQPLGPVDLQKMFGLSRAAAYRLVETIGRAKGFDAPVVTAAATLDYVRFSPEGQAAAAEFDRRQRVATALQKAADEAPLREKQVRFKSADQVAAVLWRGVESVPAVRIVPPANGQPGEIRLSFTSTADATGKLGLLMMAILVNEAEWGRLTEPQAQNKLPLGEFDRLLEGLAPCPSA